MSIAVTFVYFLLSFAAPPAFMIGLLYNGLH